MNRIRRLWILAVLMATGEFSVQADPPAQFPEAVARGESCAKRGDDDGWTAEGAGHGEGSRATRRDGPPL